MRRRGVSPRSSRPAEEIIFPATPPRPSIWSRNPGRTFLHAGDRILLTEMEHHSNSPMADTGWAICNWISSR
jgi:hypothetical protein